MFTHSHVIMYCKTTGNYNAFILFCIIVECGFLKESRCLNDMDAITHLPLNTEFCISSLFAVIKVYYY